MPVEFLTDDEAAAYGSVVVLSGEADVTTAAELSKALAAQVSAGAPHLAVDLSGLRFADSATIQALVQASRVLKDRRGS